MSEKKHPHHFTQVEWDAFLDHVNSDEEGLLGPDFEMACNAGPGTDHLHTRRVGAVGSRLNGRVCVMQHDGDPGMKSVYIAAFEARQLAAALLNAADELDGITPLFVLSKGGAETP